MKEITNRYRIKNKKTLNQQVYDALKQMFLDDLFNVGQKLNEVEVGEALGVSATPVREAFRRLAAEGFVDIIPYRGVFVRGMSEEDLKDTYQCRIALENLALELAYENFKREELIELIDELEMIKRDKNLNLNVSYSNKLHNYIIEKSNNKRLKNLMESLNDVLIRDKNISAGDENRRKEIIDEHLKILEALKNNDLELAKLNLNIHLENGYNYTKNKISNNK